MKTILSSSIAIGHALASSVEVMSRANKIFPVVASIQAELPYVCFRREETAHQPLKGSMADTAQVAVLCFTSEYGDGVELAEAVRSALDGASFSVEGLTLRSCHLSKASEAWADDAFIQELLFTVKI